MMAGCSFGHDVLSVFDVPEDVKDFLSEIYESGVAPSHERQILFDQSLIGGAEDWCYLIDCVRSMRAASGCDLTTLNGADVLTYVWSILGRDIYSQVPSWQETDQLIARSKELEKKAAVLSRSISAGHGTQCPPRKSPIRAPKRKRNISTSHYWSEEASAHHGEEAPLAMHRIGNPQDGILLTARAAALSDRLTSVVLKGEFNNSEGPRSFGLAQPAPTNVLGKPQPWLKWGDASGTGRVVRLNSRSTTSPFFSDDRSSLKDKSPSRPRPGIVSSVPFPPLTEARFGIVQEELAHEPFWLLIAITLLIKTNGKYAVPVFWRLKERFCTPAELADAANADEVLGMIRHLGLSANRLTFFQKYGRAFLERPPKAGVRHKVRNYDRRDVVPVPGDGDSVMRVPEENTQMQEMDTDDLSSWEIGHMTQGKYAIDSWRIFCRDELLGKAKDWNGKGREPEFQPEWMRVMPTDKELRAYLRWMWMREGWQWDPTTGERRVLREEMRRAVNERRVDYDESGGLRILDQPRQD